MNTISFCENNKSWIGLNIKQKGLLCVYCDVLYRIVRKVPDSNEEEWQVYSNHDKYNCMNLVLLFTAILIHQCCRYLSKQSKPFAAK